MASQVPGVQCSLCGEGGHRPSNCWKELGLPPDGFFTGGGAHRDHGDGEDEKCKLKIERNERKDKHFIRSGLFSACNRNLFPCL